MSDKSEEKTREALEATFDLENPADPEATRELEITHLMDASLDLVQQLHELHMQAYKLVVNQGSSRALVLASSASRYALALASETDRRHLSRPAAMRYTDYCPQSEDFEVDIPF